MIWWFVLGTQWVLFIMETYPSICLGKFSCIVPLIPYTHFPLVFYFWNFCHLGVSDPQVTSKFSYIHLLILVHLFVLNSTFGKYFQLYLPPSLVDFKIWLSIIYIYNSSQIIVFHLNDILDFIDSLLISNLPSYEL